MHFHEKEEYCQQELCDCQHSRFCSAVEQLKSHLWAVLAPEMYELKSQDGDSSAKSLSGG